jgi:hypothetical protein
MPYFVSIGAFQQNKCGVGSRGYHLYRRGRRIIAEWGAVAVFPGRKFHWCYATQRKVFPYRSERLAQIGMKERISERIEVEGYSRLPAGVKIHPAKRT